MLRVAIAGLLCVCSAALAVPNTWDGSASRDWSDLNNWSLNHVPLPGEDVIVDDTAATNVVLSGSTAYLGSLTIANQSLSFTNWSTQLKATNVTVKSGGVLTVESAFTEIEMSNRVYVACSNLTIDAGGLIDMDALGFAGSPAAPTSSGPGKGTGGDGAGYGGRGGGAANACNGRGQPAGTPEAPVYPGSSGYIYSRGGGAVRIVADGQVTVHGTIAANGWHDDVADLYSYGGGSGGGIYITCNTFDGSTDGLLRANGATGASYYGSGGGGGRIAVDFDPTAQDSVPAPGVRFTTAGGGPSYFGAFPGDMGTVYFPDTDLLPLGSGIFKDALFSQCRVYVPSFTSWSPSSITATNCDFSFAHSNLQLHVVSGVTVGQDGGFGIGPGSELVCGTDLTLTNGGKLYVYSGATNAAGYGALVDVTGNVSVASGSWILPYSDMLNGGSPLFEANNITLLAGGGFDADYKGFVFMQGPGVGAVGIYGGGGGYGGNGGHGYGNTSIGGKRQGSVSNPMIPGSGGASYAGNMGDGGGLVRVIATGQVTVHGTITANGRYAGYYVAGGGSGGGINIECDTFDGSSSGLLRVNGGNGSYYSGGGGGGRIAVRYNTASQSAVSPPGVKFQASPGAKGALLMDPPAKMGTVYFPDTKLLPLASETLSGNLFEDVLLYVDGFTTWSPANLTVGNCDVVLGQTGFVLNVAGDVNIGSGGGFGLASNSTLSCANLALSGGGTLTMFSGPTNATTDYGARVNVSGSMSIGDTSWVYPYSAPVDGGSVKFSVGSLSISTNGGINADQKGYGGGYGAGLGSALGYGPGSGHGGVGGQDGQLYAGGPTYGSSNAPTLPGSGGDTALYEAFGGGLVRVEAGGQVTLHGTVTAKGQQGGLYTGGAGSGGGIFITCNSFESSTNGLLNADGGPAGFYGGAGGGGRIAVWYKALEGDLARMSVTGGLTRPGANGTIYLYQLPPAGTLLMLK